MTKNSFYCNFLLFFIFFSYFFIFNLRNVDMCVFYGYVCEFPVNNLLARTFVELLPSVQMQIARTNPFSDFVRFVFDPPTDEYFRNSFVFSGFQRLSDFSIIRPTFFGLRFLFLLFYFPFPLYFIFFF